VERQNRKAQKDAYKQRKTIGGIYAIKNDRTGKVLLLAAPDIGGIAKRFEFAYKTGTGFHPKLQRELEIYGKDAFSFFTMETLEKRETQTDREFHDDLETLLELWRAKYAENELY